MLALFRLSRCRLLCYTPAANSTTFDKCNAPQPVEAAGHGQDEGRPDRQQDSTEGRLGQHRGRLLIAMYEGKEEQGVLAQHGTQPPRFAARYACFLLGPLQLETLLDIKHGDGND